MQVWPVRSCGVLRLRPLGEVGRRADDRHAHVRPDAHGDHVLGHLLAEAHAGVVALGDDVGQAVVDDDLDLDVRIVRQEPSQGRPEDRVGRVLAGRDADGAGGLLAQLAQRRQLGLDLVEARARRCAAGARPPRSARRCAWCGSAAAARAAPRARGSVWLSADCETPSFAAALVKLRSRATARKARRSLRFSRGIHEPCS